MGSRRSALTTADYEAIVRLVGEIGEMGPAAVQARRRYFLSVMGAMLGTRPGGIVHMRPEVRRVMEVRAVDWDQGRVIGTYRGPARPIEGARGGEPLPAMPMLFADRGPFYRSAAWGREEGPFQLPARLDEGAFGRVWTSSGDHFGTVFVPEGRAFTARQREVLRLAFGACWRMLLGDGSPAEPRGPMDGLAPRLRRVAERLLAGDSMKQAARHLGLSEHTVAEYSKMLHRHFGVSSRSELLLALMGRRTDADPAPLVPGPHRNAG